VRRNVGIRTGQGKGNKNLIKVRRNEGTRTGQGEENKNLVKVRRNEEQELVKVRETRTWSR
jgi:hypothetical protein